MLGWMSLHSILQGRQSPWRPIEATTTAVGAKRGAATSADRRMTALEWTDVLMNLDEVVNGGESVETWRWWFVYSTFVRDCGGGQQGVKAAVAAIPTPRPPNLGSGGRIISIYPV